MVTRSQGQVKFEIDARCAALFAAHGMRGAADFLPPPAAVSECLRDIGRHANYKLTLRDGEHVRRFYLKIVRRARGLRSLLRLTAEPGACAEWAAAKALGGRQIPVPAAVACGEHAGDSFFVSEDIAGASQLDHFLRDHAMPRSERNALALELADVAQRFHAGGFCHKDFYLCHFFVKRDGRRFALTLIDLQRVEHFDALPPRWRVKDLAALYYSSGQAFAGARVNLQGMRLRFYLRYAGCSKLRAADKKLIRKVAAKAGQIRRHDEKSKRTSSLPKIADRRDA